MNLSSGSSGQGTFCQGNPTFRLSTKYWNMDSHFIRTTQEVVSAGWCFLRTTDRSREDEWCGPITHCRWQCCAFDSTARVHSIPVKRGDRILRKLGFYINIFGILLKRKTLTIFNLEYVWRSTTAKNIFTLRWGLRGQYNMENGRNYLGFLTTHISSVIWLIQACTAPLLTPRPWDPLGGWQSNLALHFGQRGSPLPLPPQWHGKELWNGVQKKRKLLFVKNMLFKLDQNYLLFLRAVFYRCMILCQKQA